MSIGLTDELEVKTKKGKLAAAKQVFLDGDQENLQQIGDKTHQLENAVKDITATGGASTANAVSYNNKTSGMTAVTAQGAIDELAAKNKTQDSSISTKAEKADVQASVSELKAKNTSQDAEIEKKANSADVNTELDKKFNKEDIAQDFGESKDKVVSQFALPYRYIQNEEFIFAKVDAEDRLLFGFQWDGTPVFGKTSAVEDSLQSQVNLLADKITAILGNDDTTSAIDTLKELKNFFASIDNTQTLTGILANLNNISTKLGEDIKNLQDTKVDKEEGKSLIEDEVKECFRVIENDEFIHAVTDAEDRVLFGIYRATGEPYYPLNEMYHVEQNEEFFALWLDAANHVLLGIRRDGEIIGEINAVNALKQVVSQLQSDLASLQEKVGAIDNLKELLDVFSMQENPEYLATETDADGKVLSATYNDGSHYSHNLKSETFDAKVDKEEGKSLINSDVAEAHSTLEDPEKRMEIVIDADGKVMSYRDADGKKHEHDMEVINLEVSNLNLQGNSVNNIQNALKANGFDVKTPIDWSDSSFIQIPEPRLAIINITNINSMPTTKKDNKKAFLEFWDMYGNYFKKHAILNAQGNSSMGFVKKNVAIDLCDDEWVGDNTPKVRIGNWVPQDSFHMKAYYTDFFRGVGAVSYKLYDQIVRTRGDMYDRPWKKALLDMSKIGITTKSLGNPYVGDFSLLTDTGARCFPDGFPVAVYLNDKFYGIFSFQLKKHRDNYHMDKSTAEHVHLDGIIDYNILWNGTIVWGAYNNGFEVRNPKNLYAIGGNKYDADIKQEEIAGKDEVDTWIAAGQLPDGTVISSKIKKNLQMTAKVKKYIQDFANTINTINDAASTYETSSKTEEDLKAFKAVFEKYYDVENLIDYLIVIDILGDGDSLKKNWQWFTYNGIKWWVGLYDCDGVFGAMHLGDRIGAPSNSHLGNDLQLPTGFILKYYNDELEKRYAQLADVGIISADNIFSLLQDWCMRIGTDFFKEEYKKWSDSPCIADSVVRSEYWEAVLDESGNPQTDTSETFDATLAYNVGYVVSFGLNSQMGYFKYKCIKGTTASSGNTPHTVSVYSPIKEFKHCDNIYRAQKWIEKNTANMDKVYHYTRNK